MGSYGQNAPQFGLSGNLGRRAGCIAGGGAPRYKVGAVTIDWSTVPILLTDATISQEGRTIKAGDKYLRYGTVLCRITATGKFGPFSDALTANTLNGAVLAGATSIVVNAITGKINPGDILHIAAGGGTAEDVVVQSVSGTTITLTAGLGFGHADATAVTKANDGRSTLARGYCYILDHTVVMGQDLDSDHPGSVFDGGGMQVYAARVASDISGGVAQNPTKAQLDTAFPGLSWLLD